MRLWDKKGAKGVERTEKKLEMDGGYLRGIIPCSTSCVMGRLTINFTFSAKTRRKCNYFMLSRNEYNAKGNKFNNL